MIKFFTIKTLPYVGIGDQLGTQFSRLYLIGESLGATYQQNKFDFERSAQSDFKRITIMFTYKVKKLVLNLSFQSSKILVLVTLINFFEKILLCFEINSINLKTHKFLGIEYIKKSEICFKNVDILSILKNSASKEIFLNLLTKEVGQFEGIILEWTPELNAYCSKIDKYFNDDSPSVKNCFLNKSFWKNKDNKKGKRIILFHQRCGDSVSLNMENKDITILGPNVYFNNSYQSEFIVNKDSNRESISIENYIQILNKIQVLRKKGVDIIFISDGYQATKQVLINHYFNNIKELNSKQKKILIYYINKDLNKILLKDRVSNYTDKIIIGESFSKLKKSIYYLASAEAVLFGAGGFAVYMHSIFRKTSDTYLGHLRNHSDYIIPNLFNKFK